MWIFIVSAIVVLGFLYWFFILRPGRIDFWSIAAKDPNSVYDYFKANNCWIIFEDGLPKDYRIKLPEGEWDGPYRLVIPKLGNKMIYVFGKEPDYRNSQKAFVNKNSNS